MTSCARIYGAPCGKEFLKGGGGNLQAPGMPSTIGSRQPFEHFTCAWQDVPPLSVARRPARLVRNSVARYHNFVSFNRV